MEQESDEQSLAPLAGPILLCAATRWEAEPLAAALGLKRAGPRRWKGALGEHAVELVQTGVGRAKAEESLLELSNEMFGLAMSVGFAGALQRGINSGDILCDIRGADAGLPPLARRIAKDQGLGIHFGKIAHSDRVLSSPDEKRELGLKERAGAVDMETKALRDWGEDREVPVLPVRVTLDALEDRLPRSVPAGEDFVSLLRYVLSNLVDLPVMIATGLKQRRAIANLSRFLQELIPNL